MRTLATTLLGILLATAPGWAAPATSSLSLDQMDIIAQSTEYDGRAHTYQVRGTVRIELKGLSVTCDEATIFTTPKEDKVDHIVFSGQVVAKRGPGTFRGERVTYHVATRRLVADGGTHTRLMMPASGSTAAKGTP